SGRTGHLDARRRPARVRLRCVRPGGVDARLAPVVRCQSTRHGAHQRRSQPDAGRDRRGRRRPHHLLLGAAQSSLVRRHPRSLQRPRVGPFRPQSMTHYQLWVFLHVASVIVWLGAGTTLVLATLYAQRAGNQTLEAVTGFAGWLGPRVFAPSSLAALVFGIVAVRSGHWGSPLWVRLGIGAFAV